MGSQRASRAPPENPLKFDPSTVFPKMTKLIPEVSQKLQKWVPRPPRQPPNPDVLGGVNPYKNLIIRVRIAYGALIGINFFQQQMLKNGSAALLAI